jgi:LSD1 subclass zinc finger protein
MVDKQDLVCSGCQKTLRIPEKYWGKKVRCPQCSAVL